MLNCASPYARVGQKLVDRGYPAIPIMPGRKCPGEMRHGEWRPMSDWTQYGSREPTRYELQMWNTYPDAGVGVVCGKHLSGIDIDTDDSTIKGAIISVLPPTTVKKKGAKGETWFYQGLSTDKSVSWRINKKTVCDFIGPGRQTVLPPTVHPDTEQPYVWTGAETLEGIEPRELPELPDDIFERIGEALNPFGWTPEPKRSPGDEHSERGEYDGGTLPRMLNNEALDRIDDWVPYLGLEKLRKTSDGYVAVAHWRASNRGRPLAERSPNLGISFRGIVDFGDGAKGYRPIDLVMAAVGLDYWWQAYRWLDEQLHGPYPIIGDLMKAQQARMKTTMETADPVVDRALNLLEEQAWMLDEEHSGQGNENENMTSETQTIEPLPRLDASASDILELVKIGNWRKLNQQPTAEEIATIRDAMVLVAKQEPMFRICGDAGVEDARRLDDQTIAELIREGRRHNNQDPEGYDQRLKDWKLAAMLDPRSSWLQASRRMEIFLRRMGKPQVQAPSPLEWLSTALDLDEGSGERGPLWELTFGIPGLLGELVEWIVGTARRPNRVLALGSAITLVGTLVGRRVLGPTNSATHLYVLNLAPTGAGKQHQIDCVKEAMVAADASAHIGPSEFISQSAVINLLVEKPLSLCLQDEYGAFLKRVNAKRASGFEANITKVMREVWGISGFGYNTPEWAGRRSAKVSWPALSLCAFSTPDEFYGAMSNGDLPNGFLNRFVVLSTHYRAPETKPKRSLIVPPGIRADMQALFYWRDPNKLNGAQLINPKFDPTPDVLQWASDRAETSFRKFQRYNENRIDREPGLENFMGRASEIAVRIATIRAVGRAPGNYEVRVTAEDFQWAAELVRIAGDILAKEAPSEMEEELTRGQMAKRIIGVLKKYRGVASQRDLFKAIPLSHTTRDRDDVLKALIDRGTVEPMLSQPTGHKGRPASPRFKLNNDD